MRITCLVCEAQYELPPALAARLPARTRCARCGAEWEVAAPDAPAPIPDAPQADAVTIPAPPVADPGRRRIAGTAADRAAAPDAAPAPMVGEAVAADPAPDPLAPRLLWLGSIAIVVVLVALVLAFHGPIGRAWAPSLRLYRALGLA